MLIDTHCHLDFQAFDADRVETLERAQAAGVGRVLNPAIDLETSRAILLLAQEYPFLFAAVGVHPNSALTWNEDSFGELCELAVSDTVKAIGEIGLDYYRDRAPKSLQQEIFCRQLELANQVNRPVIIHCRETSPSDQQATRDLLAILAEWQAELRAAGSPLADRPGVLHSYASSIEFALQAVELGFFIGITGPVTFQNAKDLQKVVACLPLNRIVIETDAPFLTPHPYRGKRNEPAYVRLVADKIAELQGLDREVVAKQTTSNAERLFNWQVNL
jgi:TatD DNase family protein